MSVVVQVKPACNAEMTTAQQADSERLGDQNWVHQLEYNPNPKTRTWERLESMRLQKLGLSNNYSRHFNVTRSYSKPSPRSHLPQVEVRSSDLSQFHAPRGSFAPFHSPGKPTCGYFFSRDTDNKKQKIGIPPANLVKWRSFNAEELHGH